MYVIAVINNHYHDAVCIFLDALGRFQLSTLNTMIWQTPTVGNTELCKFDVGMLLELRAGKVK